MNIQKMISVKRRENSQHYNKTEICPIILYSCLNNISSNTSNIVPQPTKSSTNYSLNYNDNMPHPSLFHSHHHYPNTAASDPLAMSENSDDSFHVENLHTLLDSLDDPFNNNFQEKNVGVVEYFSDHQLHITNTHHIPTLDEMLKTSGESTSDIPKSCSEYLELDCNKYNINKKEKTTKWDEEIEKATNSHKQRIRWTTELHDLFLDAILTLGGPEFATPKKILGIMNVKGLSIYHVKSHLQKYRLAKNVPDLKHEKKGSTTSTEKKQTYHHNDNINSDNTPVTEALRMQIQLQKLLHEQLKAQRELQLSIEQNGEFLRKLIEKQNNTIGTNN